ncbi:hypothetical protein ACWD64_26365 [Streptomyces antibioticus]
MDIGGGEAAAVRLARGNLLRDVVGGDDPEAWIALDAGVRQGSWGALWELTVDGPDVAELVRGGRPLTEEQLALALCHRDGRIRGAALARAAGFPELLPLVVVRCSDWVPQVREEARRLLAETLDARTVAGLMPLILRVGRRDRGDFVTGLARALLRAAPDEALARLYAHPRRTVQRFAYRLAVEEGLLSAVELARAAARGADTVVQSLCADAALAAMTGDDAWDDVLEPLLGARGPRARSAGVTALRRAGRAERAAGFLPDRSGMVRACARYVVRQLGGDPRAWYRERCADPADPSLPPGAVLGLAECGERADAVTLWPLLGHPAAGVRARAVAGLRVLDTVDVARLWPLLDDPSPSVVREVTAALLPSAERLPADRLLARLGAGRPPAVRTAALRLLDAYGGVPGLRAAVALLDDPDVRLAERAERSVRGWRPTVTVPGGDPEVTALLTRAADHLGEAALRPLLWEAGARG